jgi:hypothetical protein
MENGTDSIGMPTRKREKFQRSSSARDSPSLDYVRIRFADHAKQRRRIDESYEKSPQGRRAIEPPGPTTPANSPLEEGANFSSCAGPV